MPPTRDRPPRTSRHDDTTTLTQQNIAREAWREYKTSKNVQGAATEVMLGTARPPRAFVDVELGFGLGEGPSLQLMLVEHRRAASRGRRLCGDHSSEHIPRPKRESADAQQRRLRNMLERAGAAEAA